MNVIIATVTLKMNNSGHFRLEAIGFLHTLVVSMEYRFKMMFYRFKMTGFDMSV